MNFTFCLIAKNEEKTLPRLLKSLEEFKNRGGKVILVDTGSTDKTVQVARDWGVEVHEEGDRFIKHIDKNTADKINKRFLVDEEPIVKEGDKLFDYSEARNYAASLSQTDMIFAPDCDEVLTSFDLDALEEAIKDPNLDRLEYDFVFSHQADGSPAIQFLHSKFYRKSRLKWKGIIHEVLQPI